MHDLLQPDSLKKALASSLFSRNIIRHETLDSTNTLAKDLALAGAPEGTIIIAEEQTAGRGRRGRTWLSPGKGNIFLSILVRPALSAEKVFSLTMVLALACLEAIRRMTGLACWIKWPNDLYVGNMKLAGILTEFAVRGSKVEWVVLGLGLNVNWHPQTQKGITYLATSLFKEKGEKVPRNELLVEILTQFDAYYREVLSGRVEEMFKRWNASSLLIGRQVVVESDQARISGKALRIDQDGALIIEDGEGKERRIIHGEASLRFKEGEGHER